MTSRISRHRPRAALAALTLTFAVGLSAVVAGQASAAPVHASAPTSTSTSTSASAPVAAGHTLVPLKAAPKPTFTPNAASPAQATSNCDTVRAELKQYAARHVQRVSCTTVAYDQENAART
jgi:hypothetical protein